jgi:hypothetical protein
LDQDACVIAFAIATQLGIAGDSSRRRSALARSVPQRFRQIVGMANEHVRSLDLGLATALLPERFANAGFSADEYEPLSTFSRGAQLVQKRGTLALATYQ